MKIDNFTNITRKNILQIAQTMLAITTVFLYSTGCDTIFDATTPTQS